jgi:cytochrome c peroxidase
LNAKFKTLGDDAPQVACSTCHKRSRHVEDELPPPAPRN